MAYHFIESKLAGMSGANALSAPLVFDIRGASKQSGATVQSFPQNSTNKNASDAANQLWEFNRDPSGSGFFYIQSKLDGYYLINPGMSPDTPLTANNGFPAGTPDQALWQFVNDPAGSGYFFIQNKWNGCVIDIQGASPQQGTVLITFPMKLNGASNQLWRAPFPSPVSLPSSISYTNLGTGNGTTMSGSNECAYNMSLTIQQDGTCQFSGTYTNRGDTDLSTAPGQDFGVCAVVHDMLNNPYVFVYGCYAVSAPQQGCTVTWGYKGVSQDIASNWASIALRSQATAGVQNNPPDKPTYFDIWNQMCGAVLASQGGNLGPFPWNSPPPPNVPFWGMCPDVPTGGDVASGPGPSGSKAAGWEPDGSSDSH